MSSGPPELLLGELAELSSTPPLELDDEVDDDATPPVVPPGPQRKNPLCGATKWGFKALAIVANVGCCAGGFVAWVACSVGLDGVKGMFNGIDCNKECKPDCPVA